MTFRAITIGDGDLSFSLALKRAYPEIIVTATTLVETPAELHRTYSNAIDTSKELQQIWKERIIYGVDATKIEDKIEADNEQEKFDIVLFNHPHLGDATLLESEQRHAERHHILLSHYFHSARQVLKQGGRVHLCLCGSQPKTWKITKAAENAGLVCVVEETTSCPIEKWLFKNEQNEYELAEVQSHYPTKRKYRNGKLGSKHFLAKYGYRHRRIEGDLFSGSETEINVERSLNFVFAVAVDEDAPGSVKDVEASAGSSTCQICKMKFDDPKQLNDHMQSPALPDVASGSFVREKLDPDLAIPGKTLPTENSSKPPSFAPLDISETAILVEAKVGSDLDSKRLKWICRQPQFPLSKFLKSKKECTDAIKQGRVYVNSAPVLDDSRIIKENDTIVLVEEYDTASITPNANDNDFDFEIEAARSGTMGVEFVKDMPLEKSALIIAYKPVGIRCVGSFSPNTLEMITKKHIEKSSNQKNMSCQPISKLDTGCAGLCALVTGKSKVDDKILASLIITYTFSVLVHGKPGDEWKLGVYAAVPTNSLRLWKRQKTDPVQMEEKVEENALADASNKCSESVSASIVELDLDGALLIQLNDHFQFGKTVESSISTLTIQSRHDDGRLANVISYCLRKLGYPVVNDRFAKREYSALPRRMKNILKQKVCICCNSIDVDFEGSIEKIRVGSNKRTQCSYWKGTLSS